MRIFIDCIVDNNYSGLVRSGNATPKELLTAWELIYSEYCDLSNIHGYRAMMTASKDLAALQARRTAIDCFLTVLSHHPSQKSIDGLRSLGYKFKFDWNDKEGYAADLNKVRTGLKSVEIAIRQKENIALDTIDREKSGKLTREKFDRIIAGLAKYMGFNIDKDTTTVSMFAAYRATYNAEVEATEKFNEKHKAKK